MRGISDGADDLAAGAGDKFMNAVALRTVPPRSSDKPKAAAAPLSEDPPPADLRNPLQKLMDRFK